MRRALTGFMRVPFCGGCRQRRMRRTVVSSYAGIEQVRRSSSLRVIRPDDVVLRALALRSVRGCDGRGRERDRCMAAASGCGPGRAAGRRRAARPALRPRQLHALRLDLRNCRRRCDRNSRPCVAAACPLHHALRRRGGHRASGALRHLDLHAVGSLRTSAGGGLLRGALVPCATALAGAVMVGASIGLLLVRVPALGTAGNIPFALVPAAAVMVTEGCCAAGTIAPSRLADRARRLEADREADVAAALLTSAAGSRGNSTTSSHTASA